MACCTADADSATAVSLQQASGIWHFSSPAPRILKISYKPENYNRDERLSDAVVLSDRRLPVSFRAHPDTVMVLGECSIGRHQGAWYIEGLGTLPLQLPLPYNDGLYRGFRFALQEGEAIFGGGGRAIAMNRRGFRFDLYNQPHYGYAEGAVNLNFSVPLFFSSRGYALFFDNVSRGYADVGAADVRWMNVAFFSGELNVYLIGGETLQQMVHRFSLLTGRQPLPPRWALGAFVSRFGYQSRQQAETMVSEMQQQGFPFDAVVFDLFWFGDSIQRTLGNLDWINARRWPQPEIMMQNFARQGIRTVLITEPFVVKNSKNYTASLPYQATDSSGRPYVLTDFYFGHGGLLDLFRRDAQQWFLNFYRKQIDNGVAGWWGDLGEPEKHPPDLFHDLSDLGYARKFSADEVHNLYGHYWSKMLYDYYDKHLPDVRLFHLNRAGFAGSQRYCVFPWTGDVSRSWSGLRAQLPLLLGLSLCGIPFIHSDAGGFAMGDYDPELFTRWVQFAVFTPILRPHGTALEDLVPEVKSIPSEPVFYPEPYKSVLRRYYRLRYELLPYLYTLAYRHSQYGDPLMRPLFYYDFSDSSLFQAADQYFFGESLLVAPVLQAGASARRLYLPAGRWYPWSGGTALAGGRWLSVPVTFEDIPVFVRAGSFIPLAIPMKNTDDRQAQELVVCYYHSNQPSAYELYDDDGLSRRSLQNGQYCLMRFEAEPAPRSLRLHVSDRGGHYAGMPDSMTLRFRIYGLCCRSIKIVDNGRRLKTKVTQNAPGGPVEFSVPYNGRHKRLELHW